MQRQNQQENSQQAKQGLQSTAAMPKKEYQAVSNVLKDTTTTGRRQISLCLKASIKAESASQLNIHGFTEDVWVKFVLSGQCSPETMTILFDSDNGDEANNRLSLVDMPNFVEKHFAKVSLDILSRGGWLIQNETCVLALLKQFKLLDSSYWSIIRYHLIDKAPKTPDRQDRFTFFFKQGEGSLHLLGFVDWLNEIKQSDQPSFDAILSSLQILALGEGNFGGDTEYRLICIIVIFMLKPNIMHDPTQRALQENLKSFAVKNRQFLFGEGKKYDLALTNAQEDSNDRAVLFLQALIQPIWIAAWAMQLKAQHSALTGWAALFDDENQTDKKRCALIRCEDSICFLIRRIEQLLHLANDITLGVATTSVIRLIKQLSLSYDSLNSQDQRMIRERKERVSSMIVAVVLHGDLNANSVLNFNHIN